MISRTSQPVKTKLYIILCDLIFIWNRNSEYLNPRCISF